MQATTLSDQPNDAKTWDDWSDFYESKCERLSLTYGDAGITVHPNFAYGPVLRSDSPVLPAEVVSVAQSEAATVDPDVAIAKPNAVAQCLLS